MKAKHIIRIIAFIIVTLCVVYFAADFMQVNNGRDVAGMFGLDKEKENSLDVALIGPSQVYASYYAPLAYKEYGYTSYPISTSAMAGSLYKYAVKEMQERQDPKLYIIEISGFFYSVQRDEPTMRKYLDNINTYSKPRLEAIDNLVDDADKLSFYIPFIKYHNNLQNIKTCFMVYKDKITITKRGYSLFKNFSTTDAVFDTTAKGVAKKSDNTINEEGFEYLDDLLDYLKESGIENVVFASFPDEYNRTVTDSYAEAIKRIEDAGYVFENFYEQRDEIGLDPKTDYYNVGHVNINGAEKMTRFLGEYITTHYDVKSEHPQEVIDQWEDCASQVDKVIDLAKKRLRKVTKYDEGVQAYVESAFYYGPTKTAREQNENADE